MGNVVTIDLDRLREDIAKKRKEIQDLEAVERAAISYQVEDATNGTASEQPAVVVIDLNTVRGKATHEAAEVVLKTAGKPLKTAAITNALLASGYGRTLSKPQIALFTAMNRKKEIFKKTSPGVWALTAWDRKEAGVEAK